ncbi:hypothetical protein M0208_16165 [Sphingomonas sp. SUN019]|uniref:hypothetical protein n=1 Tax=Sphingomonas sp. SUN019 TaxID=2937788 RepID=UPI00216482EC|nr:hypothetical protein [Sphingomonas sp. SUN019]UVO51970.1 hypothetical protein M0208_16165 [Sphingomonas sp. SUN019]
MSRPKTNHAALIVAGLSGALASMAGGFLIASYTISGITPAYATPPRPERMTARVVPPSDDWREANYRHIGLWDEPVPDASDTSL